MSVPKLSAELTAIIVDVLREKRSEMELSKKKLAATAGISRTAIILMEGQKTIPSLGLVIRLSMSMRVPFSSLVAKAERRLAKSLTKAAEEKRATRQ